MKKLSTPTTRRTEKEVKRPCFIKWYENGTVMIEETYRDGKKEGLWREYFRNGVVKSEGPYLNDLRDGRL